MEKQHCYGHYSPRATAQCASCRYARWCRDAGEPELLEKHMSSYDEDVQDAATLALTEEHAERRRRKFNGEQLRYSRNDLLEVIIYMLNLDPMALELLEAKIQDPDITLSEIARRRHTSRQAVQQALKRKCKNNPELARLLANREQKLRQRKQPTFMEAVCQIRRQQSSMNSNKPAPGSKSYRSLNSWNQNFDLSKMSILKGSAILPNA